MLPGKHDRRVLGWGMSRSFRPIDPRPSDGLGPARGRREGGYQWRVGESNPHGNSEKDMKLLEFLNQVSKDKFDIQIKYFNYGSLFEVEVDAIYEKWVVSFDKSGDFSSYTRFGELETKIENPDGLIGLFDRPQKVWEEAAKDLGITFIGPYKFSVEGNWYCITGLLPDFGSGTGTLIMTRKDDDEACFMASVAKYHTSVLSPYHYDRYDRDRFIETLTDWGWFGKGEPPTWFKGKIISE